MGDVLRQLCYPLVLPFIVGAVWLHAWALRQDARSFEPTRPALPTVVAEADGHTITVPGPRMANRIFTGDDSVASVDADTED